MLPKSRGRQMYHPCVPTFPSALCFPSPSHPHFSKESSGKAVLTLQNKPFTLQDKEAQLEISTLPR